MSCRKSCIGQCFYCGSTIEGRRHEHDHAPVPARHGGTDTVPACIPCHDLKDRFPLDGEHWTVEMQVRALAECGPLGRIYLAKFMGVVMDAHAARADATP